MALPMHFKNAEEQHLATERKARADGKKRRYSVAAADQAARMVSVELNLHVSLVCCWICVAASKLIVLFEGPWPHPS